jgi:hypothetical protein
MKEKLKPFIFPLMLLLFVIVLAAFKLHGSSIEIWNQVIFGVDYKDPNLLYGQPRGIRSDEWLVLTPWILSQAEVGFKDYNNLYLAGQSFTQTDAPEINWAVFDPPNWAFFFLPLEQAFAFKWWFKTFLLAVAVYLLAMMLTKNNILVSAIAAISFVFSPYIQWWYSTSGTEIMSFGILTFVFFVCMINNLSHPLFRWINAFFFAYFAICFALTFYPPWQIPLAIFFALVGVGYVFSKQGELANKKYWRTLIIVVLLSLVAIGIVLVLYYFSNQPAIQATANTVYPGSRQAVGGENGFLLKAIAGFYNVQLLNDARILPDFLANQCEASSYFFFSFFLLPFYLFFLLRSMIQREYLDPPLVFSIVGFAILLIWETIGLPSSIAKLLLLNYVPVNRTMFSLGIINLVLIIYYVSRINIKKTLDYKIVAGLYSIAVFLIIMQIGKYIQAAWPGYIDSELKIFLIAGASGVMMALLLFQKKLVFFSLFLVFTLVSTFNVNPIYRGLSPLHNAQIVETIENIKETDPQAGWVVYDHLLFGNYLASNGVRVLNAVYLYPNLNFWSRFDPQHKYVDIYNRYAHVDVIASADPEKVEFAMLGMDHIQLEISPCNPLLEEVGVKYYLFITPKPDLSCISLIKKIEFPAWTLFLYKRAK